MSGDGGGASIADLTEHGPSSADLVIHPGLSGPSGSLQLTGTREYELKLNAMRLKLMSALNDIPVGHAVVTSQAVTTRATLIALGGQLPDRVVTFYLVPGTTPSEIAENARELVEAGAVTNPVAARMLLRWAAVVTTAMDL
jgi:hypothetical protein